MKNILGKILCWIGIHKLDDDKWIKIWQEDGYSGKICNRQKNWCQRCGKYVERSI